MKISLQIFSTTGKFASFFISILNICWLVTIYAETDSGQSVKIADSSPATFSSDKEVRIQYVIENKSNQTTIVSDGSLQDIKIELIGPNGAPVTPYPYTFTSSKVWTVDIRPDDEYSTSFDLAMWFPFDKVGDYKCKLTRRVYKKIDANAPFEPHDPLKNGQPIDLTAPDIQFRVESLIAKEPRDRTLAGRKPDPILDGISKVRWYDKNPEKSQSSSQATNPLSDNEAKKASIPIKNAPPFTSPKDVSPENKWYNSWLLWLVFSGGIVLALIWMVRKPKS